MRIGICSWSDRSGVSSQTWPRMKKYCKKHNYTFNTSDTIFEDNVKTSWMKLKMLQFQSGLDYIVWFDDDIIVTNTDVCLSSFVPQMGGCILGIMGDVTTTQPRRFVMNMGVIIVKCCNESLRLLDDLWVNGLESKWRNRKHLEQDFINHRYHNSLEFKNKIHKFAYGTLQTYIRPRVSEEYLWKPGDFSAHITGMPYHGKKIRVRRFIRQNNL